jgi:tol-pal system protein YbgF
MKFTSLLTSLLLTIALSAHAESAVPVYDVDGMSTDSHATQQGGAPKSPIIASDQASSNTQRENIQSRLNNMQSEIQSLRGQVEELMHQVQVLNDQQQLLRTENQKLSKNAVEPAVSPVPRTSDEEEVSATKTLKTKTTSSVENKNSTARTTVTTKSSAKKTEQPKVEQPNNADEQAVYQTAYNLIKAKKYNEAIDTLQKMLIKYPAGQTAANAHYWLGELYSLTGENDQAATEFRTLIKGYPSNPRVADAQLKLGLIYAAQLKWADAKALFKKVSTQYPGTSTAQLANEQLKQLKQEGH